MTVEMFFGRLVLERTVLNLPGWILTERVSGLSPSPCEVR
jgi:hypothetical protein